MMRPYDDTASSKVVVVEFLKVMLRAGDITGEFELVETRCGQKTRSWSSRAG